MKHNGADERDDVLRNAYGHADEQTEIEFVLFGVEGQFEVKFGVDQVVSEAGVVAVLEFGGAGERDVGLKRNFAGKRRKFAVQITLAEPFKKLFYGFIVVGFVVDDAGGAVAAE